MPRGDIGAVLGPPAPQKISCQQHFCTEFWGKPGDGAASRNIGEPPPPSPQGPQVSAQQGPAAPSSVYWEHPRQSSAVPPGAFGDVSPGCCTLSTSPARLEMPRVLLGLFTFSARDSVLSHPYLHISGRQREDCCVSCVTRESLNIVIKKFLSSRIACSDVQEETLAIRLPVH